LSTSCVNDVEVAGGDNPRLEQETLLHRLMEIDPDRSQRYRELLQQT
jgi:hypothetical protein